LYYTIYKITNKTNGKYYIGKHQTKDLNDGYMGSGKLLRRAIKEYGIDNFTKEILFIFDNESDMNAKEKELVVISEESYNLCPGGHGGFGYINENNLNGVMFAPKEQKTVWGKKGARILNEKIKIDAAFRKKVKTKRSEKLKQRHKKGEISYPNCTGKRHKEETKIKMSKSQLGRKNSQYGTCWITNGQRNKKIKKEEIDKWLELGYNKGRI